MFWSNIAYVRVITFIFTEFLLIFLKVSRSYRIWYWELTKKGASRNDVMISLPPLGGIKCHEKVMVLIKFQNSLTSSNLSLRRKIVMDIMIINIPPRERWSPWRHFWLPNAYFLKSKNFTLLNQNLDVFSMENVFSNVSNIYEE